MNTFYTQELVNGENWRALERFVARVLSHLGWKNIYIIGGAGDKGGDILATRPLSSGKMESWVAQVKSVSGSNYVGISAVNEANRALGVYGADVAMTATNGTFTKSACSRSNFLKENNFSSVLWNGAFLKKLVEKLPNVSNNIRELREYQTDIVNNTISAFDQNKSKAFYIVATGLGKTVIAATIAQLLWERGCRKILVLCHATDLALQLEQSFWPYLTKEIPTSTFYDGERPKTTDGISFGLFQSLYNNLAGFNSDDFDAIIVDEAHHACSHDFRKCLKHFKPKFLLGMTATPWRGDAQSIEEIFGQPLARISIVDGMAMGYLAQVDYRIFNDNIDWQEVTKLHSTKISIRELNKRLFLPQRDSAVIEEIQKVIGEFRNPRIAVFSPSIEHCNRFSRMLINSGIPCAALSTPDKIERRKNLLAFSSGKFSAIAAVDIMNEGIDIPDVNILVFLRATHSRRIFIQQLGRGLRICPSKSKVIVLDFVSDIRRIADLIEINNEGKSKGEKLKVLFLKQGMVSFTNRKIERFVNVWLQDIANLGEASDNTQLTFPDEYADNDND